MSAVKDAIVLQDDEYVPCRTCRCFYFEVSVFHVGPCVSRPLPTGLVKLP